MIINLVTIIVKLVTIIAKYNNYVNLTIELNDEPDLSPEHDNKQTQGGS